MTRYIEDFTIPQGTTWSIAWQRTDGAGAPIALATGGWQARCEVRTRTGDLIVGFHSDPPGGEAEWTAAATVDDQGIVTLLLTDAQSAALPPQEGVWLYDVELVHAGSPEQVDRLVEGRVTLAAEVTTDD